MIERLDYQQQEEEDRRYWQETEGRRQAVRDQEALKAHRIWKEQFFAQEKTNEQV